MIGYFFYVLVVETLLVWFGLVHQGTFSNMTEITVEKDD